MINKKSVKILNKYIFKKKKNFLKEFFNFLKIPSISHIKKFFLDIKNAEIFIKKNLKNSGADKCFLVETKHYSLVYAEKIIKKNYPTILIYGHYDIQDANRV